MCVSLETGKMIEQRLTSTDEKSQRGHVQDNQLSEENGDHPASGTQVHRKCTMFMAMSVEQIMDHFRRIKLYVKCLNKEHWVVYAHSARAFQYIRFVWWSSERTRSSLKLAKTGMKLYHLTDEISAPTNGKARIYFFFNWCLIVFRFIKQKSILTPFLRLLSSY